ncbi:MAG: hypothetical protein AAGD05_03415, partial [Bacteroidota bacterium]
IQSLEDGVLCLLLVILFIFWGLKYFSSSLPRLVTFSAKYLPVWLFFYENHLALDSILCNENLPVST